MDSSMLMESTVIFYINHKSHI